jgi:hypothetical protein
MISSRRSLGRLGPRLLAILIVCLAPGVAAADSLIFTNECRVPLVVHTSYVVNGRLFRNKPYLLRFNERTPVIPRTADLTVTICDGRAPNRVLFQGGVRSGKDKLHFGIVPDPRLPGRVTAVKRPLPPAGAMVPGAMVPGAMVPGGMMPGR